MEENMPRLSYIQSSLSCLKNHRLDVLKLWEHKPGMAAHANNVPVFLFLGGGDYQLY